MPPMVAWSTVDVSGPNSRPKAAAARFSDACITPGSTRAVRPSGSRSIVYGETKDKVLRVHAVLVGGGPLVFGQCRGADLASGLAGPGAAGPAAALAEVRERYRRPLAEDLSLIHISEP